MAFELAVGRRFRDSQPVGRIQSLALLRDELTESPAVDLKGPRMSLALFLLPPGHVGLAEEITLPPDHVGTLGAGQGPFSNQGRLCHPEPLRLSDALRKVTSSTTVYVQEGVCVD